MDKDTDGPEVEKAEKEQSEHLATEAARSARSSSRAAWASALAALAALVVMVWTFFADRQENVSIIAGRYFGDYPTKLSGAAGSQSGRGGIVDVMWELLMVNNGRAAASIVSCEVAELVPNGGGLSYYSRLYQGIFDSNLEPVEIPFTLQGGEARRVLLRTGILMAPEAHLIARDRFGSGQVVSMEVLRRYLFDHELDIYGNPVESPMEGSWQVNHDARNEQFLQILIETGRMNSVRVPVSWYVLSGLGS